MLPVGLQLYSVREDMEKDFKGTLKKVKEMGYEGVEFAGLFDHSAQEVKEALEEAGLIPLSAHVPFLDMLADPEGTMKTYAAIGCSYIVIPYLNEEYRPGCDKFQEVIDGAHVLGETANKYGMTLLYHNHDFEFVKLDGKYALDILYDTIPANLLQTEIDTCWVNVAGEDPAAYVRKYTGRAPIVHLKDFFKSGNVTRMYELIGIDDEENARKENGVFEFRPLGHGLQDISSLLKAAKDAHAKWVVVEQDQPSMEKSPMECVKMSIDYLNTLK